MDDVSKYFNYFLQRDIVFSLDSKIIKEGKLILFNQKDYYCVFHLKGANDTNKKYEIPYPFEIIKQKNYLILSYKLENMSKNDIELFYRLKSLNHPNHLSVYDNKILLFEKNTLDLSSI